jgi:carbon-monoxide dehydrogenase small subunit
MREIICFTVNGDLTETGVPSHYTLLETLRYILGLTGSKQGCDKGDCGACTVLVDGEAILSCLTPVQEATGRSVVTVEGLADGPRPSALQEAFDLGTPGILCSATQLLSEVASPTRDDIGNALSGNLCRCTGYTKIFEAVEVAAEAIRSGRSVADVVAGQRIGSNHTPLSRKGAR